ncbi:MAG: tRNA guanosine(34) transglycosylase Tgt [Thermomicrobiales bacterium]|nr:tRNA guanosine(34) transglycosylase Tgt [Thermomicrobiales bacterium]
MTTASPPEPNRSGFSFPVISTDPTTTARRGRIQTTRGVIETPVFMPVGTQATVKTLHPDEVAATGAQIILSNTYHLMLRPGLDVIEAAGGLHRFMQWQRPVLTDSGGFQIFSLASQVKVTEEGASFQSHIDGSRHLLTPERAVQLQYGFGSDIMMQLDHVVGYPAEPKLFREAMARSGRWLQRCVEEHRRLDAAAKGCALFGISQGGMDAATRQESARIVAEADVAGCAVGGLSVGEPKELMLEMLEATIPHLPKGKPRYLMGVGSPEDLWQGVARGIDMFDCVLPTRLARNAALFTPEGRVNIRQTRFRHHHRPIDESCDCATCATFTAAYVHHLFRSEEVLGLRLASVHNLRFLAREMERIRSALECGMFEAEMNGFLARYRPVRKSSPVTH